MKGFCPYCEKKRELRFIERNENIPVKNETIEVQCRFLLCETCNGEFEDPEDSYDPLEKAYCEYRKKYSLMQPEEIKAFRKKYGLTQQELSSLLGWGLATLSRYENGSLQDDCHEKALRLATNPCNLLELIERSPSAITEKKRAHLIHELENEKNEAYSFTRIYEERFGNYKPDILSGYKPLNISKLFSMILFFCKSEVPKTKLNKLLFYADFAHFKEYSTSITGARYVHLPHGPVPDNYEHYYATLIHEEGAVRVEERFFSQQITGEYFLSQVGPDLTVFDENELSTLLKVKKHFENMTATQIREVSHNEEAYKSTNMGENISYEYAEYITSIDNEPPKNA